MSMPLIGLGFGLVTIAAAFLVVVFFRAWRYPLIEPDVRYNTVIISLMVGTFGVGIWSMNPLTQALGYGPISDWLMVLASVLLFGAMVALIGSTAIGGTKTILKWFLIASASWTVGFLTWWYLL